MQNSQTVMIISSVSCSGLPCITGFVRSYFSYLRFFLNIDLADWIASQYALTAVKLNSLTWLLGIFFHGLQLRVNCSWFWNLKYRDSYRAKCLQWNYRNLYDWNVQIESFQFQIHGWLNYSWAGYVWLLPATDSGICKEQRISGFTTKYTMKGYDILRSLLEK